MDYFKIKSFVLMIAVIVLSIALRCYRLDTIPPSLYTDEVDQGYNAYSILKTGRDEHGIFMPVAFRSFGDWKPPLPVYLMVPSIGGLGLNETAVRLPSALLGIGTIIISYLCVHEVFDGHKNRNRIALLAAFFLAISPWHIFQSRTAMLVMVGLFVYESAVFFFIKARSCRNLYILSAGLFSLTLYSYYGFRLITPLTLLGLAIFYLRALMDAKKTVVLSCIVGLITVSPLFFGFMGNPDVLFGRAKTVSVFYDQGVNLRRNELITQETSGIVPIIRLFHNSFSDYWENIIKRFFSHFEGEYLFLKGDAVHPFQIPNMGIFYIADFLFLFLGSVILVKKRLRQARILALWLITAVIPASLTFLTPASNRSFNAVIPMVIIISLGIHFLTLRIRGRKIVRFIVLVIPILYAFHFRNFLNNYMIILPEYYAENWSYKWSEVGKYLSENGSQYDSITILNENNMVYPYILFYSRYDPRKFQKEAVRSYSADVSGFEHVEGFSNYTFIRDRTFNELKDSLISDTLYIVPVRQMADPKNLRKVIRYPSGLEAVNIFYND